MLTCLRMHKALLFDPDQCGVSLNCAKLHRSCGAPPDLFWGALIVQVARPEIDF